MKQTTNHRPQSFISKFFLLFVLAFSMSDCQLENEEAKDSQNAKMTTENISKDQLLNELKKIEIIEFVANIKHLTNSDELLKNNKITLSSSKNSIFQKITKPNEYITYSLRLNSYTSLTPYFKYFIINKEISGIEKAGFVKYIPTLPTYNLDVDNFTGIIEIYNTNNELFAKTVFLKGQPVIDSSKKNNNKTSSCYNTSYVVAIPCSHGGGHMPGQSCDNGLTNDAYYEIRTTVVCVDTIKSIVPPDTFGGGGGGGGGGATILNLLNVPEPYEGEPSFSNESYMFYHQIYNFLRLNPAYNNLVNHNYSNANLINDWLVPSIVDYFRYNDFNEQQNQINAINAMNMFTTFLSFESNLFNFEEMLINKYQTFQVLLQNSQWLSSQTNQTKQEIFNYLLQNHLNNETREFTQQLINSMLNNDGYSADGFMGDSDNDNIDYTGPKQLIPNSIILNDGSTLSITFGTTQSDNKNSNNEVAVDLVNSIIFAINLANSKLDNSNKINSIYIAATTNGIHSSTSNHTRGTAVDISRINGIKMINLGNNIQVKALQDAFDDYSKIRENFGPSFKHKTLPNGSVNLNWPIGGHQDHIHVSVQSY
ncbi:hypothetical protein [Flavobacterium fryxellicola]|uniref:Uncharacterized protein n=1 Tax=Flavobacterium fryxellicola TaxID=249352 RepID=A0A167XLY9_9FLAO|nr:hypothetical protein [Flavobacterium fryxellicola]OAB28494.1 hypothetical protein FBFR_07280 [Flavobacterium fryxellicola]